MRLTVNNLGPIKNNSQSIDLSKRFYVFVGKNNSGKTYLTQLLWTLFNKETINKFSESYKDIDELPELESDPECRYTIKKPYINILLKGFADFLKLEMAEVLNIQYGYFILDNINIKFNFSIKEIDKSTFKSVYSIKSENNKLVEYLTITKLRGSREVYFREDKLPEDFFDDIPKNLFNQEKKGEKHKALIRSILHILLEHNHDTFFLPANRLFYSSFYQYIYQIERSRRDEERKKLFSLLEKIEISDDDKKKDKINSLEEGIRGLKRPYTEPINKVFSHLYSLNIEKKQNNYYSQLIAKVSNIMGGSISINNIEGISPIDFSFKLQKRTEELPMHLASSSINQLTLLYLYLKYWAEENNNFLMIDEPEENLYIENQIALLDILIQFSNLNNNKVLITTHSPLMANVINSYLHLGTLQEKYNLDIAKIVEEENLNYLNPKTFLEQDNVGVYFFTGSKIIDYEAEEYGIYFRDFVHINRSVEKANRTLTDYIYIQNSDNE